MTKSKNPLPLQKKWWGGGSVSFLWKFSQNENQKQKNCILKITKNENLEYSLKKRKNDQQKIYHSFMHFDSIISQLWTLWITETKFYINPPKFNL